MRKSALFLSSYESEPLEWIVFQTGIELEPGRHPAHAGAHWPIGELVKNRRSIDCGF